MDLFKITYMYPSKNGDIRAASIAVQSQDVLTAREDAIKKLSEKHPNGFNLTAVKKFENDFKLTPDKKR